MYFNPIIERELRIALRVGRTSSSRLKTAATGSALVAVMLVIFWLAGNRSIGLTIHRYLFFGGLYLCISPALAATAGLFSEERRNQTLELLYLTGMSEVELFIGKLLGAVIVASTDLLALAPLLAIPFLCGGVSYDLFIATLACFPVVLLFVLSVGTFASVMRTDEGSSRVLALAIIAFLSLFLSLPFSMGTFINGLPPFANKWLCLSPSYAPWIIYTRFGSSNLHMFWLTVIGSLFWSLFFIVCSAFLLRRNWRKDLEQDKAISSSTFLEKFAAPFTPGIQERLRRTINSNAYQWLVVRDSRPAALALMVMVVTIVAWCGCWALWPTAWPSTLNLLLTASILIFTTGWLQNYAAAKRIGEDRRDGVLELLLTTPLKPEQIVEGQLEGIRALFRPIRVVMFILFLSMMLVGFLIRTWTMTAIITYLMVWTVLLTSAIRNTLKRTPITMWIALNTGRPMYSVWRIYGNKSAFGNIITNFWISGGSVVSMMGRRPRFPYGGPIELTLVAICFVAWVIAIATWKRRQINQKPGIMKLLISEFRSVATDPIPDPKNPRFKDWDTKERFFPRKHFLAPTVQPAWPFPSVKKPPEQPAWPFPVEKPKE